MVINYINNNKRVYLVNKRLFELIGFNYILKNDDNVLYYGGNGKLIIEYKNNKDNKDISLLIMNYNKQEKYNIFFIMKNQLNITYKNLLSQSIDDIKKYNFIMPFNNFIKSNNNFPTHHQNNYSINNYSPINNQKYLRNSFKTSRKEISNNNFFSKIIINNIQNPLHKSYIRFNNIPINYNKNDRIQKEKKESFEKDLLKIFINIFYYEKNISEKKENAFHNNEKYYLINPKWLIDYKKYYNYEKLYNILSNQKENYSINFNNLENNIDYIINNYNFNKDILNYEKKELSKELIDIKAINCSITRKYNIEFIFKSIIIPFKIMELIKKCYNNFPKNLFTKELIFNKNNIIYINKKNAIIGKLNINNYFIPEFIFSYNTLNILKKEKNILLSDFFFINEYIKYSVPIENNYN